MKDPYIELYKLMGEATTVETPFFIAKIKSVSPFQVILNNIILDSDDLLIDSTILRLSNANITCSNGLIEHNLKDELFIGNSVVLFRIGEKFIIISKVVQV